VGYFPFRGDFFPFGYEQVEGQIVFLFGSYDAEQRLASVQTQLEAHEVLFDCNESPVQFNQVILLFAFQLVGRLAGHNLHYGFV